MREHDQKLKNKSLSFINWTRKKLRAIVRNNFARLPDGLRAKLERRMFQIHLNSLPPEIIFKLAETKEELEQSFRLLHDSYVRLGYMQPNNSGLRVTPYHAIPTTTTLVAKIGAEVIGTVSLIRESSLKLPIQTAFDLSQVMGPGDQAVEISSLAIHPLYRGQEAQLLFWLSKYVLEYSRKYFAIDFMFITINPKQVDLYENIILFQRLQQTIVNKYDFANGAPAVAEYIDMKAYSNRLLSVYWNQPLERNVYAFIMVHQLPRQFQFPQRAVFSVCDPVMTPELLDYFFNQKTSVFNEMSDEQLAIIHEQYRGLPEYQKVLPALKSSMKHISGVRHNRYQVQCPATFCLNERPQICEGEVTQVSAAGFLARIQNPMNMGDRLKAQIRINNIEIVEVDATVVYNERELAGFVLEENVPGWSKLIAHLKNDRNKTTLAYLQKVDRKIVNRRA